MSKTEAKTTKSKKSKSKPRRPARITELPQLDPLQRYEVPEGSLYLRQSRSKTYEDIRAGRLQIIRDGGRVFIPGSEIVRLSSAPSR